MIQTALVAERLAKVHAPLDMLTIGMAAPNVRIPDAEGRLALLKKVAAKGPLILYFYPKDFTPG